MPDNANVLSLEGRVAVVTGAGSGGVFRVPEMENALAERDSRPLSHNTSS